MKVQIQRGSKSLNGGDGTAVAGVDTVPFRSSALVGEQGADEDSEHGPAEAVVPGERVAQAVRHGEDPLPDRQSAEDVVDEVRGEACHSPAGTGRADRTALTGQSDEQVLSAPLALEPGEPPGELTAAEELAQLALDEVGQALAVTARSGLGKEGLEVVGYDPVENAVLRVT